MRTSPFLALLALTVACTPDVEPEVPVAPEPEILDQDDDGWLDAEDCDDANPEVHPDAEELENGFDDNCDGRVDEGTDAFDDDGDGWIEYGGDCDDTDATIAPDALEIAYDGIDQDCDGSDLLDVDADGFDALVAGGTDCDDLDPAAFPGAEERPNELDDNCDGVVDEGTINFDDDLDGWSEVDGDCDDGDPERSPSAEEIAYDDIDNDCDGLDLRDLDGDHHDAEVMGGRDCDDTDPTIHAGAEEIPYDEIDQDCDGLDLVDVDGDGVIAIEADGTDCDDTDPLVHPGLEELPDAVDNDCNGTIDEGTVNFDDDLDGYSEVDGDCDDDEPLASPGLEEVLGDGIDNDCDYLQDERMLADVATGSVAHKSKNTQFGSVLAAGDFDADGTPDFAVAARMSDTAATDAGEVWVISSDTTGPGGLGTLSTFSILGVSNDDNLGTSLASVSDLDGDGAAELLIGAPGSSTVGSNDGSAYLLYSQSTWDLVLDESAEDIADVFGSGVNNARGGSSVAAGDLDGDGSADFVVGSKSSGGDKGKVWATEGRVGGAGGFGAFDLQSDGLVNITGADSGDEFGGQIAVFGDLDGTGYGTLAVTATGLGEVYLFPGQDLVGSLSASDSTTHIRGETTAFGALTAADLDGDGDLDLLGADGDTAIYAFLNDGTGFSGSLHVATSSDVIVGTGGQELGAALAVADLDGDGVKDLLFGAPGNDQEISDAGAVWTTDAQSFLAADGLAIEAVAGPALGDTEDMRAGSALVVGDGFGVVGADPGPGTGEVFWIAME